MFDFVILLWILLNECFCCHKVSFEQMFRLYPPPAYLVGSGEFRFLYLEVKESRNCDCIEKPGSETEKERPNSTVVSLHWVNKLIIK